MDLLSCLGELIDFRVKRGRRIDFASLFSIIILGNLSGYFGYRKLAKFGKLHGAYFTELFNLKHPLPSYATYRFVLMNIDEQELIRVFNKWSCNYCDVNSGDWVSGDGKSLRSTVDNADNEHQDFQSVVSLFCQESGLVYKIATFRSKKEGEIGVVENLVKELENKGLRLRFDALHTQKKL